MIDPQTDSISLGPWLRGLVNVVTNESIPLDGLAAASNVDIDRDGVATTRHLWSLLDDANYSSIFEHNDVVYAVRDGYVGIVGDASFVALEAVANPLSWTLLRGVPVYTDYESIRSIIGGVVAPIDAGFLVGDEGDEYQLEPLPGGSHLHYWQGRLLVGRGNTLYWSEPMRYAWYSAARSFIRFESRVQWIAPLRTGVYVGLKNRVVFLSGSNPSTFVVNTVGAESAPGVSAVYDPRHSGNGGEPLALWFTESGIAVGSGSGQVSYPQAENLKGLPLYPGKMVVEDDRVFIFTTKEH